MAGFHIDRISEDIKREIVSIMRELKDPRISDMLTVVKVELMRLKGQSRGLKVRRDISESNSVQGFI